MQTTLRYLAPMDERAYYYQVRPPAGVPARNTRGDHREVEIADARSLPEAASLEREGFELARHATAVANLWDPVLIRRDYYPEMEALVRRVTRASRVVAFDHNVRSQARADRRADDALGPVRLVHNDYTDSSGPQRVRDLMPADEVPRLLDGRVAVINVWKPIVGPVRRSPLAVCDARSLAPEDRIPTELRYADRVGEIYSFSWSDRHRWYVFPGMEADEALLLVGYDSSEGVARCTAHSAVDLPETEGGAPDRESIEVRTLVFY